MCPQQKHKALSGFLFLGSSESIGELSNYYTAVDNKWKIYQNNEGIKQAIIDQLVVPSLRIKPIASKPKLINNNNEDNLYSQISGQLFSSYVPPSVIINDKYEIVHVFNDVN